MDQDRKWSSRGMTERDIAEYLDVKLIDVIRLRKNRTFPKPINPCAAVPRWRFTSVRSVKRLLAYHEKLGHKIPEVLFTWYDFADR